MKEIFISYSTIDLTPAETVRNVLEKNGFSCWMAPRDIPGGSNYTKEIPIAIRNCKVFLLILSKNAQNSPWVLKELDSAVNCGKVILPFMLEDCLLNDEFNFLLTGAQRYAAYQKKAEAMETLIGRIRGILDVPEGSAPAQVLPQAQAVHTPQKPAPAYFTEAVCSACGGSDLKPLPHRVKRQGFAELITMLLIPVMALVFALAVLLIFALAVPSEGFILFPWALLAGLIGGGFVGDHISKTNVERRRLRHQIRSTCYRCNRCGKVFRYDEKLDA